MASRLAKLPPFEAAYVQIPPDTSRATGMIRTARVNDVASDIAPINVGDGTSPSICIVKILTATAVARISGATTFTIAELMGPVDENNSSCASTMAVQ